MAEINNQSTCPTQRSQSVKGIEIVNVLNQHFQSATVSTRPMQRSWQKLIINQSKGSNRQRSQSAFSTEQLRNTLNEYDKDNDGYINWNEFCDIAHDKQYNNSERD
eukprot:348550_1